MSSNKKLSYSVKWSNEDDEYVATCLEFPSLSWLERDPVVALQGLIKIVENIADY